MFRYKFWQKKTFSMPIVWKHFRCTLTHLPIVKPCYDNQRVSLHAYVNKLLLCRCKVICAAIHSLQLSAASRCPCMKKSCNILSAFLRCKSCKVNPFLAHCHALGWTPSETMTGGAPEVRSNKSFTLWTLLRKLLWPYEKNMIERPKCSKSQKVACLWIDTRTSSL